MSKLKIRVKHYITSPWETETVSRIDNHDGHKTAYTTGGFFRRETCIPLEGPEQPYRWEWA